MNSMTTIYYMVYRISNNKLQRGLQQAKTVPNPVHLKHKTHAPKIQNIVRKCCGLA